MCRSSWRVLVAGGLLAAGTALLGSPSPGLAQSPQSAVARQTVSETSDELLVGFHDDVPEADADNIIRGQGATKIEKIRGLAIHRVKVPPQARNAIEQALAKRKDVTFVERNRIHSVDANPNDPSFGQQWHHPKIMTPGAWDLTQGSATIIVAILDTGVDATHPDLAAKIVPGFNFFSNNTNTADVHGHGTKVAGTAAAIGNNSVGVAGVSWLSRIMPIRVTDASGFAFSSTISSGITYAADNGAKVVNISIAGVASSPSVTAAATYANGKGTVVVAGAGNCGCTEAVADNLHVISVSATDQNDLLASFSSRGNYVDLAAPGVGIMTTTMGGGYAAVSGTSFSGPIVAGVAALMMAANPGLTPTDIDALLKINADEKGTTGWDPNFGYGRVNAFRAVSAAAQSSPSFVAPPPAPTVDTQPPANVTSFTAATSGPAGAGLSWTNPTSDFAGVLVLRRQGSTVADTPTVGQSYSAGQTLGASTVVYQGTNTTFSDSGLSSGLTYFYKAFSFDAVKNYAAGATASVTAPASTTCAPEIVIDNLQPGQGSGQITFVGTWAISASTGAFGANGSVYNGTAGGSYTFKTPILNGAASCTYDTYVWWTSHLNRSTTVPITVSGQSGSAVTKQFNQQVGGGQWTLHGQYTFPAGAIAQVAVSSNNGQAAADAVRLVLATAPAAAPPPSSPPPPPPAPTEIIIDNGGAGTSFTGSWCTSAAAGGYGGSSLYSCGTTQDTYRWTPTLATSGTYDVYVWWAAYSTRATNVPISVTHANGTATQLFNEQSGGGQWKFFGQFSFSAGAAGFVQVSDLNGQASADAVRFVLIGTTTIEAPPQSP